MTKPAAPTRYAVAPNGDVVAQTDEQAIAGLDNGYTPTSGDVYRRQQEATADQKYVDEHYGTAGKAALGAASGLTLGLAPSIASRMGFIDKDHLEAAEQSGAFQAGDIAGMVAPTLLSGGESLAARGLAQGGLRGAGKVAAALTPAGLMGEAGSLAEHLAGKFLGEAGILGKLANPTIRMAARGATEGAINNLAHTVSDTVIQNKPLAADALLMSGVDGALFGGLTGGILGGVSAAAGAGIDVVGGRVAGLGAKSNSAAKYLKFMDASEGDIANMAGRKAGTLERAAGHTDDGLKGVTTQLRDVLEKGEGSIATGIPQVRKAIQASERGYEAGIKESVRELQLSHPDLVPKLERIAARADTDLTQYAGTSQAGEVGALNRRTYRQLKNVKTWEGWSKTREDFANKAQAPGLKGEVYKTYLNIIDDEMVGESSALLAANPDLAKQYAVNVVGKRTATEFAKMTEVKAANPVGTSLNTGKVVGAGAWTTLMGLNPLVGAGMAAGHQLVEKVKQAVAAPMAEAAYRSALGAQANHATINIGSRMSKGVKGFLNGTGAAARGEHAESYAKDRPSYTMESYRQSMKLADELTSLAHQSKVREITDALAEQGHGDMAKNMAETYGRAVAYVAQNKPKKGTDAHKAGKLGKTPAAMGLSTGDMKFIRGMHTLTKPMASIIGGLERGDLSRDAVAAFQYTFPAAAADLNMRVAQELVEYRNEGKFVPADKVAMIGTLLNHAVDSKLEPEFVDACQAGLAANKAPAPDEGQAPPPATDVSSFQTPLQTSIS